MGILVTIMAPMIFERQRENCKSKKESGKITREGLKVLELKKRQRIYGLPFPVWDGQAVRGLITQIKLMIKRLWIGKEDVNLSF